MSWAFRTALIQNPNQSYEQLLMSIRLILRKRYSQKSQLSSSHPMDIRIRFLLWSITRATYTGGKQKRLPPTRPIDVAIYTHRWKSLYQVYYEPCTNRTYVWSMTGCKIQVSEDLQCCRRHTRHTGKLRVLSFTVGIWNLYWLSYRGIVAAHAL